MSAMVKWNYVSPNMTKKPNPSCVAWDRDIRMMAILMRSSTVSSLTPCSIKQGDFSQIYESIFISPASSGTRATGYCKMTDQGGPNFHGFLKSELINSSKDMEFLPQMRVEHSTYYSASEMFHHSKVWARSSNIRTHDPPSALFSSGIKISRA